MSGESQHPSAPRVPGYLLTRPLGRGPQAEVWKALQERTGKWVAVKVFTDREAFDWEALRANTERLVRLDRHPNVVSLLDADLAADPPYFAMDLMEDDSLARRLASGEPVSQADAVSWLEDAARALAYIHGKGLLHGGLKPANILIDEQGRARISDLGQVRRTAQGDEAAAEVGDDIRALAEALASVAGAGADEDLTAVLAKCRAGGEGEGYSSVTALLADLEARRGRFPVSPLAASRPYRLKRFLQRHTAAAVLAAACAGALGWGVVTVSARNASLTAELASSYSERARNALLQGQPAASALLFARSNMLKPSASAKRDALAVLASLAKPRASWVHGEAVRAVALSPDGRYALAGGEAVHRLYEASSGAPIGTAEDRGMFALGLGPQPSDWFSGDGRRALSVTAAGQVELLDPSDGRRLAQLKGSAAALSERGGLVAVVWDPKAPGGDNIVLYDSVTGKPTGVSLRHSVRGSAGVQVALSPDGTRLASVGGGILRLWDPKTGRQSPGDIDFGGAGSDMLIGTTESVSFDASGTEVLVKDYSQAYAFDARTGRPSAAGMRHEGRVLAAVSAGATVVTGGEDGMVRFWSGGFLRGYPVPQALRHAGPVNALAVAPGGAVAASAGEDGTVRFWNLLDGEPFGPVLHHGAAVTALSFSEDGRTLLSGARDGVLRLWDAPVPEAPKGDYLGSNGLFSPDAAVMLHTDTKLGVTLRTVGEGRVLASNLLGAGYSSLDVAKFSRGGSRLLLSQWDSDSLWVFDARTGARVSGPLRLPEPDRALAGGADISPDGGLVAAGGGDGLLVLFDAADGAAKGRAEGLKGFPSSVEFSPDGRRLAATASGQTALWDLPPGSKPPLVLPHGGSRVVWSPDGRRLATADEGDAKTLLVWDARTGRPTGPALKFAGNVAFVAFSPDGGRLAAGFDDGTVRLVDPETGLVVGPPMRQAGALRAGAFSPDSAVLATCGLDGTVNLWDAATGAATGRPLRQGGPSEALAFTQDGKTLWVIGNWKVTPWSLPWMREEVSPAELVRRAEETTGLRLDERGTAAPLPLPPPD